MSKHVPKSEPVCYGCGGAMVVAPQSLYETRPKKHRPHILWVCPDTECSHEWSNSAEHGVVQCSCGTFWGQLP